jgi:hypothetical protein
MQNEEYGGGRPILLEREDGCEERWDLADDAAAIRTVL